MTTDQIINSYIEHRAQPRVEMCSAEDCYRYRPAIGQQGNGWSLISVGCDRFVFCPWHSPPSVGGHVTTQQALRQLKACVNRCQQLIRTRDN